MTALSPVIHIVDDDPSFRSAIANLLGASGYQVALYESGDQFLKSSPGAHPGCILLDVNMSGLSGLELQERLSQLKTDLPIIFLTGQGSIPASVKAMKSGAEDFLTKPVSKDTLFETIERALRRHAERQQQDDRVTSLRKLVNALTPREYQVLMLVVRGRLNKQIAHELQTSERTIKAHRHAIMEKLQVHSVAEAVLIAERLGMLSADEASKPEV